MLEIEALIEFLMEKGIITKDEMMASVRSSIGKGGVTDGYEEES